MLGSFLWLYILNGEKKVTAFEESKDLSSLALDELIGNQKVHEVVMEKYSKIYKGKKERNKSIALKAKKESSDDETSTSDEEYAMAVRNFKKFFIRKGKFVRQPREERKSLQQRDEKKGKSDRKCFRCGDPKSSHWRLSKNISQQRSKGFHCSKAYVVLNKHTMKIEKSLGLTFDESPLPTKLSPLVDDDGGEEDAIRKNTKIVNTNNEEDESIEVEEIVNIKESKIIH
uniref:Zf-CCHC domain-containing protein/UBN2 domain-containing protein n=1 Tax=Tanacetum cinerariifolium TaxID=118510 RepID=A0A6L2J1C2_TANCI|nr:zf-CCHC domain-containing protein/UBN2 domain-containing protein [Tanacetum cinerariifolium]